MKKLNGCFANTVFIVGISCLVACSYHEDKLPLTSGVSPVDPTVPVKKETFRYIEANILGQSCNRCHGAALQKGGVRLDSYAAVMDNIRAGSADESLLYQKLNDDSDIMPPKGKLPNDVIKVIADWINNGAKDD